MWTPLVLHWGANSALTCETCASVNNSPLSKKPKTRKGYDRLKLVSMACVPTKTPLQAGHSGLAS